MSNITTVYNTILSKLATLYPSKTRLVNPYDLEDNPQHLQRDGYGLKVDASNPEDFEFKSKMVAQSFFIVLTKEVLKIDGDITPTDTAVIALLEDINSGQKLFYNVNQLGIEQNIEDIDLGGVSPVTYYKGETNFISMEYEIIIKISEDL